MGDSRGTVVLPWAAPASAPRAPPDTPSAMTLVSEEWLLSQILTLLFKLQLQRELKKFYSPPTEYGEGSIQGIAFTFLIKLFLK